MMKTFDSLFLKKAARFFAAGLTVASIAASADPVSVASLADGPPVFYGKQLSRKNYVVVKAKKLAHAKVVWLNLQYLRELGIEVPPQGMVPELERQIIDAFGWQIPRAGDPDWKFTNEEREVYVDRYGGEGIGVNFGSGRAASMGKFQLKGVGPTPLIGKSETFDHASGGATLEELIREAIWGEINNYELPYGGNRVLAVLDTGTVIIAPWGAQDVAGIGVRGDPLRPAHFMFADGDGDFSKDEKARTKSSNKFLSSSLPVPEKYRNADERVRVRMGLIEYARRMGEQYGTAYSRGLFHGATSPSNFDMRGPFLDYGTETAQPGYGKIQILEDEPVFGETQSEIKTTLINEFMENVKEYATPQISRRLPDKRAMWNSFMSGYRGGVTQGMAEISGFPPEIIKNHANAPVVRGFARAVNDVATYGAHVVNIDHHMATQAELTTFDARAIMIALSQTDGGDINAVRATLETEFAKSGVRNGDVDDLKNRLAESYHALFKTVQREAARSGVTAAALQTYVRERAPVINKEVYRLYRPYMRDEDNYLIENYKRDGDRSKIWQSINDRIYKNIRTFKSDAFETVISEDIDLDSGTVTRRLFNAKNNQHELEIRAKLSPHGSIFLSGREIPSEAAASMMARWSSDGWAPSDKVSVKKQGDEILVRAPLVNGGARCDAFMKMVSQ